MTDDGNSKKAVETSHQIEQDRHWKRRGITPYKPSQGLPSVWWKMGKCWKGFIKSVGLEGKTPWDILQPLLIPLALTGGSAWINQSFNAAQERSEAEQYQQTALDTYIEAMSVIIIDRDFYNLGFAKGKQEEDKPQTPPLKSSQEEDELRGRQRKEQLATIAKAKTLTALLLLKLDRTRRDVLINFLRENNFLTSVDYVYFAPFFKNVEFEEVNFNSTSKAYQLKYNKSPNDQLLPISFFKKLQLQEVDLSEADLTRTDLTRTVLTRAKLKGTQLAGAYLTGARLTEADLTGANLNQAEAASVWLSKANLQEASLRGVQLPDAILDLANLKEADLSSISSRNPKTGKLEPIIATNLRGANLKRANLQGANLQGVDLTDAKFGKLDIPTNDKAYKKLPYREKKEILKSTNLRDADLRGAILTNATLKDTDLSRANLQGATLKGEQLKETDLSGANLKDTGISVKDVPDTAILCYTTMHNGNKSIRDCFWGISNDKKHSRLFLDFLKDYTNSN